MRLDVDGPRGRVLLEAAVLPRVHRRRAVQVIEGQVSRRALDRPEPPHPEEAGAAQPLRDVLLLIPAVEAVVVAFLRLHHDEQQALLGTWHGGGHRGLLSLA
jgi:hypothetical protein